MRRFAVELFVFSFVFFVGSGTSRSAQLTVPVSKRIIGGYPVRMGESPFLVSLQLVDIQNRTVQHICGCSVIHGRFLLTAAHCVVNFQDKPEILKAFLGTLRSGKNASHENHTHTEDTDEFRSRASKIIESLIAETEPSAQENNQTAITNQKREAEPPQTTESENQETVFDPEMEFEACIAKIFIHDNYDPSNPDYDIAVLVMAMEIPQKFKKMVVPISLPTAAMQREGYPRAGTECTVFGWGLAHVPATGEERNQEELEPVAQKVNVRVRGDRICRIFHRYLFRSLDWEGLTYNASTTLCAGSLGTSDHSGAFSGDSGGPLICGYLGRYYQAGVVSYGSYEMGAYVPAYFTRVTAYEDWIKSIISAN